MGATAILEGRLTQDGTLELEGNIPLPPGPVRVTLEAIVENVEKPDVTAVLERIWKERQARGQTGRTAEEIDEDIRRMRDEWNHRCEDAKVGTASD